MKINLANDNQMILYKFITMSINSHFIDMSAALEIHESLRSLTLIFTILYL